VSNFLIKDEGLDNAHHTSHRSLLEIQFLKCGVWRKKDRFLARCFYTLIDRTGEDDIGNAVDLCFTPVLQEEKHAPFRFMILNLKNLEKKK